MVGIDRKNENSSAEARDMPASWPPAMVDIDREVPGKTADRIWQAPIQMACGRLISSMCQIFMGVPGAEGPACSHFAFDPSMIHMATPPINSDAPIICRLSRCLPITLVRRKEGMAVTTNATMVRL